MKCIYIYIYTVCVGARARSLQKIKGKVGRRSFRVTARCQRKVRAVGACAAQHSLAFSVPELGPKFGASSVFAKERGLVFVTYIGRIFRTQKHACDSDIVCARHRQSDMAPGWEHGQEIERRDARCILLRVCLEQVEACYTVYIYIYNRRKFGS